jgi:hypothetical protein
MLKTRSTIGNSGLGFHNMRCSILAIVCSTLGIGSSMYQRLMATGKIQIGRFLYAQPSRQSRRRRRERSNGVVGVVDITFGKNHKRILFRLQNIHSHLERLNVGPFSIYTKTSASLHGLAFEPTTRCENLPSGHEIEW